MLSDIRFALRLLRKSPSFLVTATLSLALGIGATTTVFSAFRAVFLRPLPYADPERLVEIVKPVPEGRTVYPTAADLGFLRQFSQSFESLGSFGFFRAVTLSGGLEPANGTARIVEPDLFPTLGARPLLGRVFTAGDFEDGNPRAVLLSYKLWQQQFNGDRGVAGRQVMLDNDSYSVIGVMQEEFQFPTSFFNMWIADREKVTDPLKTQRNLIGRLKPGVTVQQAQAELERMLPSLALSYPEARRHFRIRLDALSERDVRKYRAAFLMLCGAVGLLVLIACLNVANLVIARSVAREGEFAVRSALGAGRTRLMRQVMVESFVLAAAGGLLGVGLAYAGNRALLAWFPAHYQIARLDQARVDLTVLAFALGLTTCTAVVFGMWPALVLSRFSMREQGRTATQSARRIRWRGGLVVAEVALSLTLLIGAGLLIRSFVTLAHVDPGFRPDHVLTAMIPASAEVSKDKPKLVRRMTDILAVSQSLPGVRAAGIATAIPMGTVNVSITFSLPGHPGEEIGITYRAVSADYFRAMGMTLRLGRLFSAQDDGAGPPVAVVNEAFARKYWPGQMPVGQKLTGGRDLTVVGVVADTHSHLLSGPAEPELFCPYLQYLGPAPGAMVVLRTQGEPAAMASALRQAVHRVYPDQPVADVATMESRVADSMGEPRLYTALLGIFAGVALVLTAIGIYGVISYGVNHRTRELGIRMALGARRGDVLRFVMERGLTLILMGVAGGLAGAWVLSRYVESLLFGVTARDGVAFVLAPVVLVLVAGVACYLPARRATGIDPNRALRQE
jgi:predicted permease